METEQPDWEQLIRRGVESDELDYKAAQNWHELSRGGRAKFARHCLAMANTKGGYVVVGVGEDESGRPSLFTGLTVEQSRSFDPTEIGNFINRFADPAVDFTIERPMVDGRRYVVFVIRRFRNIPHVCNANCENELLQGVFYIRTTDASSRPAYRASEIHGIIQRALRNQRELLGRMIRGILYENHSAPGSSVSSRFQEERMHSRAFFEKHLHRSSLPSLELWVTPPEYQAERFSLSELKHSAQEAYQVFEEALFLPRIALDDFYATNVSLRSFSSVRRTLYQCFQSGLFHYETEYVLKGNTLSFLSLLNFFAEGFAFLAQFYALLGFSEEVLVCRMRFSGMENLSLEDVPRQRPDDPAFVCRIPDIELKLERSAADLASDSPVHAATIFRNFCERFNLPEGRLSDVKKRMDLHLKRS